MRLSGQRVRHARIHKECPLRVFAFLEGGDAIRSNGVVVAGLSSGGLHLLPYSSDNVD